MAHAAQKRQAERVFRLQKVWRANRKGDILPKRM